MLIPLSWLKEHVQITGSLDELSHILSMAGLEVDAIIEKPGLPDGVVLATVLEIEPHPNADRLSLVTVADGPESTRRVVCGAKNMKKGDRVALATPGSRLPGGFKIKKSKVRGVESPGMLCGADEIGLDADNNGLLLFGDDEANGTVLNLLLGNDDQVLELGLTPNRPDCLSIEGVARETSALMETAFLAAEVNLPAAEAGPVADFATVENQAEGACPRYMGRVITGVKVGPSPSWMVKRLSMVGVRSINNVVDSTNYVMMELGQPLHAFDLDELAESTIRVRMAKADEPLLFLDGVERKLATDDLVICDADKPLALAGVMGGEASGVTEKTTRVLLESAYFSPSGVRRSARRYGFHTDSSHRFERGIDPQGQKRAIDRLAEIIMKVAGGQLAEGYLEAGAGLADAPEIPVRLSYIKGLLGIDIDEAGIEGALSRLAIEIRRDDDGQIWAKPPTYRVDLRGEADLAEEVARAYGYDNIPSTLPSGDVAAPSHPAGWGEMRAMESFLASQGAMQAVNFAFISPKWLKNLELAEGDSRLTPIGLLKPLSEEMSVMRTTLLPSLLSSIVRNQNRQNLDMTLFEVGRTYHQMEGTTVEETPRLCVAMTGKRYPRTWDSPSERSVDLFDLRALLERAVGAAGLKTLTFKPHSDENFMISERSWALECDGKNVGYAGLLRPRVAQAFEIDEVVLVAEIELASLLTSATVAQVKPLPVYPKVSRDLALVVAQDTPAGDVLALIQGMQEPLVESFALFDIYEGKQLPEGKKSLGVSITYRSPEKTLTEAEVLEVHNRLLDGVKAHFGADLRI